MNPPNEFNKGAIAWMACNPVAANLLMVILLVGGIWSTFQIQKEVFPQFELEIVRVSVGYPGAAPSEVESGILQPLEEAVQGIEGIRQITSRAFEGGGNIEIELVPGFDRMKAFQDIDQAVARIRTFPEEADRPEVSLRESQREVMFVGLYGPLDTWSLRKLAERLRDRFLNDPNITQVQLTNAPDYITHVEIDSDALREYQLSLPQVANIIRRSSQDIPAGAVRTFDGEILLRLQERKVWAEQFANIDIIAGNNGANIKLSEIASIRDGFEEGNFQSRFNGTPAIGMRIYRIGMESPLDIERAVYKIMADFEQQLPPGVKWRIDNNNAEEFRERLNLIMENGLSSFLIVITILSLFLAGRLAFRS